VKARLSGQVVAAVVVTLALLALAAQQLLSWRDERQRTADAGDATAAAAAEVVGLIGISSATSGKDIDALLDGATADFRSDLADQAERLRVELARNQVSATGKVVSTGVLKLEDGKATVIVAATGTVSNKLAVKPEPRSYRLRVDLVETRGHWLVSGLEFVA
jgi:hypothetical protein